MFAVDVHAVCDGVLLVVVALKEFSAAAIAYAFLLRRERFDVEITAAFFTDAARTQPLNDRFVCNFKIDDRYVFTNLCERFCLRNGARKTVEDKSIFVSG